MYSENEQKKENNLIVLLLSKSKLVLNQFRSILSDFKNLEIISFDNVAKAIDNIATSIPDVVITDWQLEDHTAIELLKILQSQKEWKKLPVLVCLEGNSHNDSRYAFAFGASEVLTRPLNVGIIKSSITALHSKKFEGVSAVESPKAQNIRSKLSSIAQLIPLPTLVKDIIDASNDPATSASIMADLIKKDQSITARVLKIVNSAYYGFYRKIGNITHATVVLGFNEVKNIAIAACMMHAHPMSNKEKFSREAFWLHALSVGYITKRLSENLNNFNPDDAFVLGLLHDIGKVVLNQHFPLEFEKCLEVAVSDDTSLYQVEKEINMIDHAEIGATIAEQWKLPTYLVQAIHSHHELAGAGSYKMEASLIHLANYFAHYKNLGSSGNPVNVKPVPSVLENLNLANNDLGDIWESLGLDLDRLRTLL